MRLHSRPLATTYHADVASCATLTTVAYLVALLLVPWFVAYAAGNLYLYEQLTREQPDVHFTNQLLLEGYDDNGPFAYSTSAALNIALKDAFKPCSLRAWTEDDNRDGRPERLRFVLSVPPPSTVKALSVLVGVKAVYNNGVHSSLTVDGLAYAQASSAIAGKRWTQYGDLSLSTSTPLPPYGWAPRAACSPAFNVFNQTTDKDGKPTTIEAIVGRYHACNDTLSYRAEPPLWTPTVTGTTAGLELNLTVSVPEVLVPYEPTTAAVLKMAWVQYLALWFPLFWVLSALRSACIRHRVLTTRAHDPLKRM